MPLLNVVLDLYHNDHIDPANGFHDIAGAGILGLVHKATQGLDLVDPEYDARRVRALSVGLWWGSYHFGVGGDPQGQADHYLSIVNPTASELLTLDFEPNAVGATMTFDEADAFVTRVHDQTGRVPLLYSGNSFFAEEWGGRAAGDTILSQCPLWIARYGPHPPTVPPAFAKFTLWQYTDGAAGLQPHSVAGVGRCDRNKFNGTLTDLAQLWGQPVV